MKYYFIEVNTINEIKKTILELKFYLKQLNKIINIDSGFKRIRPKDINTYLYIYIYSYNNEINIEFYRGSKLSESNYTFIHKNDIEIISTLLK